MKLILSLALLTLFLPSAAWAQQDANIKHLVEQGWKSYLAKDYIGGAESLEKAANFMRAKRVETLKPFLPQAPEGWTQQKEAGHSESAGIGGAMLGGMSVLTRKFSKGSEQVEVQIMTDSPLFTSIISMLKLMPAGSEKEQGYERYKTYFAQYKTDANKNEYNIFDESGLAVNIEGAGLTRDTALLFADKVDFGALIAAIKK